MPSGAVAAKPSASGTATKRITTPHACVECKRRKIKCNGQQPCDQCMSSRAQKRCIYDKHRQRVVPSRKALEDVTRSRDAYQSIVHRLFPCFEVQVLSPLQRQELLTLLESSAAALPPSPPLSSTDGSAYMGSSPMSVSLSDQGFPVSNRTASTEQDWAEMDHDFAPAEVDVGNALSLPVERQASYPGTSSIKAAMMVMLKVQPGLRSSLAPPLHSAEIGTNDMQPSLSQPVTSEPRRVPWDWKGHTLMDAYFKRIHLFMPILDEPSFRNDHLEGKRVDRPWLALLNAVFALGSIVAIRADLEPHQTYYSRAMAFLPQEDSADCGIETVQALALMGGLYLHYVNRPDTANAKLVAAIRMASALGLHGERLPYGPSGVANEDMAATETRRRTWWSLYCLDTWATTQLGSPSFGRLGLTIDMRVSELELASAADQDRHANVVPLVENVRFCRISTAIQDMLAVSPLAQPRDRCALDGDLMSWYGSVPWSEQGRSSEPLHVARSVMKWRYQNLRMLLHRPVLLHLASSSSCHAADHDMAAIEVCRDVAGQTIADVGREWRPDPVSACNAVCFLYQAAMVPLVSIFWQWDDGRVSAWQRQIETVLELLVAMQQWSPAAQRSGEVVWRMYEASRELQSHLRARVPAPHRLVTDHDIFVSHLSDMQISPIGLDDPAYAGLDGGSGSAFDLNGLLWGSNDSSSSSPDEWAFAHVGIHDHDLVRQCQPRLQADGTTSPLDPSAMATSAFPFVG